MFRFAYRRIGLAPIPSVASAPAGLLARLFRFLSGKSVQSHPSPARFDNAPRPMVSIRIRGPVAARRLKSALLDTGSQDTLFPMELAESLGLPLGGQRQSIKWRGQQFWVEFHDVELELAQNELAWRWRARVGFTAAPLSFALLGQRGCLDYLDAKFCGADEVVELETNRNFPGVSGAQAPTVG